ncbi:MAG TPA: acyl-CoA dehydrogenase, partial [Gordonia sp. (in: high G+C Gram-positive bacteria)]|nr:acyl-CoA dehydrogenase [Gordonia sp. (in: high G+C Gram-positive bacteria)]
MTTSVTDAQGAVDLADRSVDLGAWAENTPDAADVFAGAVRAWLADNLVGDFAKLA